jgi:hypothetical protein
MKLTAFQLFQERLNRSCLVEFLTEIGLINENDVCSLCQCPMKIQLYEQRNDGFVYRCKNPRCIARTTIRDGSFFFNSRLTLYQLMQMLFCFVQSVLAHNECASMS